MPVKPRALLGPSTLATALIISGGIGGVAADDPGAPASLCEVVDISDLNAYSGLAYEPALEQASICNLVSPAAEGFHSIQLATRQGALDDVRQGESIEVTLAGLPGLATIIDGNAEAYLDLGEGQLFRVGVTEGAVGTGGMEPVDLSLAIAETAAESLRGASSGDPAAAEGDEAVSLAPPDVQGLDLDIVRFDGDGLTLQGEQPGMAAALAPLLEALDADTESLTVYQADSGGQSTAPGYQTYLAVRIAGAADGAVGPALLAALGLVDDPDFEIAETEVAGRPVTVVTSAALPDAAVYVHDAGDTTYLVQMDEVLAARVVEALP